MQTAGIRGPFSQSISIIYSPDVRASRSAPVRRIVSVGGRNRPLWRKTLSRPVAVRQRARRPGHKRGEVIHFGLEARSQQNAKALTALAFWSSFGVIWTTTRKGPLETP